MKKCRMEIINLTFPFLWHIFLPSFSWVRFFSFNFFCDRLKNNDRSLRHNEFAKVTIRWYQFGALITYSLVILESSVAKERRNGMEERRNGKVPETLTVQILIQSEMTQPQKCVAEEGKEIGEEVFCCFLSNDVRQG